MPRLITCGNCGERVAATILGMRGGEPSSSQWLQCPVCQEGSVAVSTGAVYPAAPAGGTVPNLPDDVAQAWREARTAHAVAAYTASEVMCRKILMHVAVDAAGSEPGATFQEYIRQLDEAGYIGLRLRSKVEQVKDRGNVANHELPASSEAEALTTLRITEHLLRGVYEIPNL